MNARAEPVLAGRRSSPEEDERTPIGISLALGAAALVGGAVVAAIAFPADSEGALGSVAGGARLAVLASVVALVAISVDDTRAVIAVAGLGCLVFTGFLVNRFGELSWHGTASLWHLSAFAVAAGLGVLLRRTRRRALFAVQVDQLLEKESHGA
jgi:hypothetical protein